MKQHQQSIQTRIRAVPPGETDPLLSIRWLVLLRSLGIGLLVLGAIVVIAGFITPQAFCGNMPCSVVGFPDSHNILLGLGLFLLPATVWVTLGILLLLRKAENRMMLIFSLALIIVGICTLTDNLIINGEQAIVGQTLWQVPSYTFYLLKSFLILLCFALFPNGRFIPSWTRWIPLTQPLYVFIYLFFLNNLHITGWALFRNPINGLFWFGPESSLVIAQIYRYARRSSPLERQQTKWILSSFIVILLTDLLISATQSILSISGGLFNIFTDGLLNYIALVVPVALTIALLRYRLWDIDALINNALVYGLLTSLLAAIFVGIIIGIGLFTGQSSQPVVIVLSTLAVAMLFQPLRQRIQTLIDRRFYRQKYDATSALAVFNSVLRTEIDINSLSEHLLAIVQETMQPTHVSLWLCQPGQQRRARLEKGE